MPLQPAQILSEIREVFEQHANPAAAPKMQAYMKNIAPFFGINAPQRKQLEREIFNQYKGLTNEQLYPLLKLLYQQPEREFHYLAMDWLYKSRKSFTASTIELLEWMLTTKSWWDTVDFLAARCLGYWAEKFPEEAKPVIRQYIKSDNFWLNRSAMLHQLFYRAKTDTELLSASIIPHIPAREFFLRKAIGWALRHYARTNPAWVSAFVEAHPLSTLSRREALKHL